MTVNVLSRTSFRGFIGYQIPEDLIQLYLKKFKFPCSNFVWHMKIKSKDQKLFHKPGKWAFMNKISIFIMSSGIVIFWYLYLLLDPLVAFIQCGVLKKVFIFLYIIPFKKCSDTCINLNNYKKKS